MVIELNNNRQDVGEKPTCDSMVATGTALPASILRGPCDTTVLRGAKVVLKTSYRGDPEPCVQWLRAVSLLFVYRQGSKPFQILTLLVLTFKTSF